ncbi:uncharacterized protein LOC144361296 [Saccoglossus kowalevskii]
MSDQQQALGRIAVIPESELVGENALEQTFEINGSGKDGNEDSCRVDIDASEETIVPSTSTQNVPMVPFGRKVAASTFFSYSSKDREWVEETVEKLEREHGITCMFDDRDFIPGKPILENILTCTKKCEKIVLVLSPNFLDSGWCGYEAQIAITEHLTKERKIVIPVLLKECIIPDFISHLTYLDIKDPNYWEKLLEILTSEVDNFNGKIIFYQEQCDNFFSGGFDFDDIHTKLVARGIKISRSTIENVKTALQGSGYLGCIRCHSCVQGSICCFLFALLPVLVIIVLLFVAFIYIVVNFHRLIGFHQKYCVALFMIIILIVIALILTIVIGWIMQTKTITTSAERAANSILIRDNVIMAIVKADICTGRQVLTFVYFNANECLKKVERYIMDRQQLSTANSHSRESGDVEPLLSSEMNMTVRNDVTDEVKALAKKVIVVCASNYARSVAYDELPNALTGQRHSHKGKCLCQLAII